MKNKIIPFILIIIFPIYSFAQITWQVTSYNKGFIVNKIYNANSDSVFALSNGAGLLCSTNKGNTWTELNTGITSNKLFCMLKSSNGKYFLGSTGYTFFSSNDAQNWVQGAMTGTGVSISDFDDPQTGVLYAGQIGDGIFRSFDQGETWIEFGFCCDGVHCVYHLGDSILYAGTRVKGLYNSTNAGSTWKTINNGLSSLSIHDVIYCNDVFYCATDSGLYSSTDLGAQWNIIPAMSNKKINTLYVDKHNNLFAGSETHGIYVLRSNFSFWTQENNGLSSHKIISISSDSSNYIYISTGDSLIYRSTAEFNSLSENIENALNLIGYPNPAKEKITLSFNLKNTTYTLVDIVSSDGKIVARLFDGQLYSGLHNFEWTAKKSGIYFCRVIAGQSILSFPFTITE